MTGNASREDISYRAEKLPFGSDRFDRLSMGYALRHVADLGVSFRECLRVLKPGGRILILEISRPEPSDNSVQTKS